MFNKVFNQHDHNNSTHIHYPKQIDVYEHRAPTDESVKLLNEMQEKAKKNIIASVVVQDNTFNGVAVAMTNPMATSSNLIDVFVKFKMNGVEFNIKEEIDWYDTVANLQPMLRGRLIDSLVQVMFQAIKLETFKQRMPDEFKLTFNGEQNLFKIIKRNTF